MYTFCTVPFTHSRSEFHYEAQFQAKKVRLGKPPAGVTKWRPLMGAHFHFTGPLVAIQDLPRGQLHVGPPGGDPRPTSHQAALSPCSKDPEQGASKQTGPSLLARREQEVGADRKGQIAIAFTFNISFARCERA